MQKFKPLTKDGITFITYVKRKKTAGQNGLISNKYKNTKYKKKKEKKNE